MHSSNCIRVSMFSYKRIRLSVTLDQTSLHLCFYILFDRTFRWHSSWNRPSGSCRCLSSFAVIVRLKRRSWLAFFWVEECRWLCHPSPGVKRLVVSSASLLESAKALLSLADPPAKLPLWIRFSQSCWEAENMPTRTDVSIRGVERRGVSA